MIQNDLFLDSTRIRKESLALLYPLKKRKQLTPKHIIFKLHKKKKIKDKEKYPKRYYEGEKQTIYLQKSKDKNYI